MQYAEDITRSWEFRNESTTWRSEIDDDRQSGPVHIVSEANCPDRRYSVTVTGAETSQRILIDGTLYTRVGKGPWRKSAAMGVRDGIPFCQNRTPQAVDPARIRLVAEQLRDITLSKPVIRDIGGRQCREWTRSFTNGKVPFLNTNCFDLNTHELVQSKLGNTVSTYYWNIPLEIQPPM